MKQMRIDNEQLHLVYKIFLNHYTTGDSAPTLSAL
jgi:hypothetical protein